jgi:O-antigen/teichoic acid export membrane protein
MSTTEPPRSSSFATDVLTLVGGTVLAQAIAILASPLLTRLYSPADFGLYALFLSVTGILSVVACLRYDLAIMLPERDEEAANVVTLSIALAACTSLLTIPILWLAWAPMLSLLNAPKLEPNLWMVPVAVFLGGAFNALNYWNSRTRQFKRLSISRAISSVTTTGAQIGAGLAGHATGGSMIGGSIAGLLLSALFLGAKIWDNLKHIRKSICRAEVIKGLKRYRKFPLIDTWSGLLNSISYQLPVFFLSAFFSAEVVGYYTLTNRVLQMPMSLIGSAVAQVFFQRAVVANARRTMSAVVENTFTHLMMIGLYPILIILLIGEDVFRFFFSSAWAEAGVYAQILALWILFVFVTSPLSTMFAVFERQETFLLINILLFIARAATLTLGGLMGNARFALVLYALVSLIFWVYMCIWILNRSKVSLEVIIWRSLIYLLYSLPAAICIVISKYFLHLTPSYLILISLIGVIIYYICSIKQDDILNNYF